MALRSWDDFDFIEALMMPGVDLEVDPLERAGRYPVAVEPEVIVAGTGATSGACGHCGRQVDRRRAGLCERCYRRLWRSRRTHTPSGTPADA